MEEDIRRANLVLAGQGIRWRIAVDAGDGVGRTVIVRNYAAQTLFRGFTVEGAIQWIIRQPIPQEDLDPGDAEYALPEELILFVPIHSRYYSA